eukprot:g24869.t1
MLPHLCDWAALFVDEHLEGALLPSDLRSLLRQGSGDARTQQLLCNASAHAIRALNLTLTWLHHLMSELQKQLQDAPSTSSEFSHPDVAIGFTILSYRLHGLRERDVLTLLNVLLDEMRAEACDAKEDLKKSRSRRQTSVGRWEGSSEVADRRRSLWPLELLDISDPEQIQVVFDILRFSPLAIRHLLEKHVFVSGTLDRNEMQLSASGQERELAGPQLFGRCLGFSGTPNDLLPKSMGRCIYAAGDDGKVLQALSSTDTVTAVELGQARWPCAQNPPMANLEMVDGVPAEVELPVSTSPLPPGAQPVGSVATGTQEKMASTTAGPASNPLALRHERLQGKITKYVVQSGTGFLKSHLFEGELGFKTDNVMLECQNYEFKEDENVEFDVQADERGRPHATALKPVVGRKPSDCLGQRHRGYVRRFADRWGFLNAAAFDGDLFVHRDTWLAFFNCQSLRLTKSLLRQ